MKHKPNCDLLEPGVYEAVVTNAEEKRSKTGNEMLEIQLEVFDAAGTAYSVMDYLVSVPSMEYKIRHFCESAGIDYDKGDVQASECVDRNVRVRTTRQKDEKYGEQNRVADYLPRAGNGVAVAKVETDESVPF